MTFCPKCGKKDIKGTFCRDCQMDEIDYKTISVKGCPECDKIHFKGIWRSRPLQKHIAEILSKQLKFNDLEVSHTKDGIELTVDNKYYLPATYVKEICPTCSRLKSQYFESTFQLRNPTVEALDFVRRYFLKSKKASITKETRVKNGYDFYITSTAASKALATALAKHFGGYLKFNYQIHTRNKMTSRDVFRSHILFRMLPFKQGNVILAKKKVILVKGTGEVISGLDLKTNKKVVLEPDDYETLPTLKTSVTKVTPSIEILDPESFDSVPVVNQDYMKVKAGQNVKVAAYEGRYYLF